ncbi:MAG: VanZ family protein [Clostridia bacterium]|nr:VanZ family protein [Clostridia bacterium]
MTKINRKTLILNILIVLVLAFIWGNSLKSGEESGKDSSRVAQILQPVINLIIPEGIIEKLGTEFIVRKLAHFSEFALLGFLLLLKADSMKMFSAKCILQAELTAFICAFLDESIQMFTGRGPMIRDVWIDSFGAFSGIIFAALIVIIIAKHREKTS